MRSYKEEDSKTAAYWLFKTLTPSNDYNFDESLPLKKKLRVKSSERIIEEKTSSSEEYKDDDVFIIDQLEKMRDFGRTDRDTTIERMIRDDLKIESSSPDE